MTHRIEETVQRGICIGCGACSAATTGAIPIRLLPTRLYGADLEGTTEEIRRMGSRVCPFSDESPDEDQLGAPIGDASVQSDGKLGRVTSIHAGRVNDPEYLLGSSSGGLTSWTVKRLILTGRADAAIQVGRPGPTDKELFGHQVASATASDRKSMYYATTLADVLDQIRSDDRRFVLIGVPCFIRAARALCRQQPEFAQRIKYFVALVCGHYKTQAFAESLAWQVGVHPSTLVDVDFRVKNPDRPPSDYDFGARAASSQEWHFARTKSLVGGSWGHNAFQPEACNFCDDVVGETADVSFGDAWLSKFEDFPLGTNVVISRNPEIDELLQEGYVAGEIHLEPLTSAEAIQSQAGGFRHRREGLAVRLADDLKAGYSVPKKRVTPNSRAVSRRRRRLVRHRRRLAVQSQEIFATALERNDLRYFTKRMQREISRYRLLNDGILRRAMRIVVKKIVTTKASIHSK